MSSDIKASLKEARNFYKEKNFCEAMQKCKSILKKDKTHYNALVLLGAAMTEIEEYKSQAYFAYEKAICLQQNSPLAWQGLVSLYEKELENNDKSNISKLASAYCKLLMLDSDSPKFSTFLNKLSEICLYLQEDDASFAKIIANLNSLYQSLSSHKMRLVKTSLAQILIRYPDTKKEFYHILENILPSIITDDNIINKQDYYTKYLKILYDKGNFSQAQEIATQLIVEFPDDINLLEWICLFYYESKMLNINCKDIDIINICESVLKVNESSESALIAKAVFLKDTKDLIKSRNCLNKAVTIKTSFYAWFLLAEINVKLYCWDDARNAAEQAIKLIKNDTKSQFEYKINLILIESLSRSNKPQNITAAVTICTKMLEQKSDAKIYLHLTRAKISLNESEVMNDLEWLKVQDETNIQAIILHAEYLKRNKHLEEAVDVLGSALENSEAWLLLGQIYWELDDYSHCLMAFLNGVKRDHYNWECLIYLGKYYREHGNDLERSRKCYQTAMQINPNSEEAGIGLSTAYRLLKRTEENMQLLKRLTAQNSGPKWAWLQLGLQSLDQGDVISAIKALQTVIRADPNDNHSWESLGDAYWARGAHTSALRTYQRALELEPNSLYPMIQLANIKLVIGQLEEAKHDFKQILNEKPRCIPALKGLAETCLNLAKENLVRHLFGLTRDNLQEAVDNLTEIIMNQTTFSCVWKLLGDTCYIMASLSKKYCILNVIPILTKSDSTENRIAITKKDILLLALRSYCRALSISKSSALLWHDLACCYFAQLRYNTTESKQDTAKNAIASAKHAITLSPSSWLHWNLLGVICMSSEVRNLALAQHCFVMAIDLESYNAITWANLGTLYLYLGHSSKANEAFSRAQRADPAYVNSWIGQGILAEKLERKEGMDLFRHSTELGYHDQAAIAYGEWVLKAILDPQTKNEPMYIFAINNLYAIPLAIDVLNWYLERNPEDEYALNACGLFLERQKLYNSAVEQFTNALKISRGEHRDAIRINLIRTLIKLGKYNKAINLNETIEEINYNSQCHYALALFKAELYQQSYGAYEKALKEFAETDSEKANVLCAMAAMAFSFNEIGNTKTLLFQSIQIVPPNVEGLLASAALGILCGDFNLTLLVLEELKHYLNQSSYRHCIITLSAYFHLFKNDVLGAIRIISKKIYMYPDDAKCWLSLVKVLLRVNSSALRPLIEKVLFFGRSISSSNNMMDVTVCSLSLSILNEKSATERIILAQKNIFSFPGKAESWICFFIALYQSYNRLNLKFDNDWLLQLLYLIKNSHQHNEQMISWISDSKHKLSKLRIKMRCIEK